jgi:ribosomal protein L11 methyltransferase
MAAPDRWLVLSLRVAADDPLRDVWSEVLLAAGGSSVLDQGDRLTTYVAPPPDVVALVARLEEGLSSAAPAEPPPVEWNWQENEDWARVWRQGLAPRRLTPRLVIKPTWTEWEASPGEVVLEIDPQMAFGTGEHATTRGCLRLLDETVPMGGRVLDIGSGSGILAIAAARLGAREVVAVEYDEDANINARENFEHNGVADRVQLLERMADAPLLESLGRFDLILANILSSVIRPLLPAMRAALAADGRLIVSGILREERDAVLAAAEGVGLGLAAEDAEDEWWSGLLVPVR